jgi:hypothetical protein
MEELEKNKKMLEMQAKIDRLVGEVSILCQNEKFYLENLETLNNMNSKLNQE